MQCKTVDVEKLTHNLLKSALAPRLFHLVVDCELNIKKNIGTDHLQS
jgi:hypothetical protein